MRQLYCLAMLLLVVTCVYADSTEQLIQQYFTAYNTGDPQKMREFMSSAYSGDVEKIMKMYPSTWNETGPLTVQKMLLKGSEVEIIADSQKSGPLQINFQIENGRIRSMQVQDAGEPRSPKKNDAEFIQVVTDYVQKLADADQFSGVILLAKDGHPIYQHAYGMANKPFQQPNQIDTLFNLGSINKVFTRIAIAQLLEQKKLSLEDTLAKVDPDYQNKDIASKITIGQLINMQSGMGDFFNDTYENTPKNRLRTLQDYVPLFVNDPLNFQPGTQRKYSNAGYVVLGLVVEKLSGENYYDYVQKHIFEPAGMKRSGYYEADVPVHNLADGYTQRDCPEDAKDCARRSNIYSRPARGSSAGGGYATAGDLLSLMNALHENRLIAAGNPLAFLGDVGFAGGAPGINAGIETQKNYTMIVLSNYDPPSAEQVVQKLSAWVPE